MLKVLSRSRKRLYLLKMIPSQVSVGWINRDVRIVFDALSRNFPEIYSNFKKHNAGEFTKPVWEQLNAEIENTLLPYAIFSFVRNPLIKATMVITDFGQLIKQKLNKASSC